MKPLTRILWKTDLIVSFPKCPGKGLNLIKSWHSVYTKDVSVGFLHFRGWSGGAIVLGKLPVPGRPTVWIAVGQGPTALVVGASGDCLEIFTLVYPFLSSFALSLGDGPI